MPNCSRGCFPLYVKILIGPLDQGPEQEKTSSIHLPGKDLFLHTARLIERERSSLGSLSGHIDDWRVVAVYAPEYKDLIPQEPSEKRRPTLMWYIRLDWVDSHHDIVVLDEAGRRVGSRRVAHNHIVQGRFLEWNEITA